MSISELLERLQNPSQGETFSPEEVQQLITYHVDRELHDSYNQAKIANTMLEAQRSTGLVSDAMQTLINLWKPVAAPQFEVVTDNDAS